MTEPNKAIFLSYAREDAESVRRIADALRAFGVEVWFDQNELRGGDSWDQKIKRQIRECALFLPVISATTQARGEGYFRREWKLAVERTHDMAGGVAFIVPVVIDETAEGEADVPEEFMRYQWTRLPHGVPSPQFVEQVKRLMEAPRKPSVAGGRREAPSAAPVASAGSRAPWLQVAVIALVIFGAAGLWLFTSRGESGKPVPVAQTPVQQGPTTIVPGVDAKSVAVLPFANLSPEKENEFFADGMHDDVITSLTKVRDLTVISRQSVLAYRDAAARDLRQVASELRVAHLLTGSVRRSGKRIRVTAQLIDVQRNRNVWADAYEGDLDDAFALQGRLAQEIAGALQVNLTQGERESITTAPTQNRLAYEFFLRGRAMDRAMGTFGTRQEHERVLALYQQAVQEDPSFARAFAQAAIVHTSLYWFGNLDPSPERLEKAKAAVDHAVRLAPDDPQTRLALGAFHYRARRDWDRALSEFRAAEKVLPNDDQLVSWIGFTQRRLGRWPEALEAISRSAALNPRALSSLIAHLETLLIMRRFTDVKEHARRYLSFYPADATLTTHAVQADYELGGSEGEFLRRMDEIAAGAADGISGRDAYNQALRREDYASAQAWLAVLPVTTLPGPARVINQPVALERAMVAFLAGDADAAKRFGDDAIAALQRRAWNDRQMTWVKTALAHAHAYAGRREDALREIDAAMELAERKDKFDVVVLMPLLGRVQLILGDPAAALQSLQRAMSGPCYSTPAQIRFDPVWQLLKDDPRFDQILRSAKPI
jgi:TolB-like protein